MTWTKFGLEFFDECADKGLSDAAVRTHAEAIGWLYRIESKDLIVKSMMLRRFAGTSDPAGAMAELVEAKFWTKVPIGWELKHHREVFRQSLAAQVIKRESDRERQQKLRARAAAKSAGVDPVTGEVMPDVTRDIAATQTVRTDFQPDHPQAQSVPKREDDWPAVAIPAAASDCGFCGKPVTFKAKERGICNTCWTKGRRSAA